MSRRAHVLVRHYVRGEVAEVFAGFTRELFEALAPAFPPSRLLRYDGNDVGDEVHVSLGLGPLSRLWVSEITAREEARGRCVFVDEGRRLPSPLTYWRHRHVVEDAGPGRVAIVEDVTFATPLPLVTRAMTPVIRAQFEARGPGYAAYFDRS